MSEPTGRDHQKPDPDQDQESGSAFSDPTAPFWADPTTPVPTTRADEPPSAPVQDSPPAPPERPFPPAPPGAAYPYGQQPPAPQGSPPAAPPMSNPYAQQPPVQQYGQQAPAYGQQPPVQHYGQQAPAYGQQPFGTGAPTESNVSAIVLTILSALSLCNLLAIGSLVLGIIALTKTSTDPEGSRRLTKIGWIVFAVVWAVTILGFVGYVVAVVSTGGPSGSFDSGV
jgi:hypothetical protein